MREEETEKVHLLSPKRQRKSVVKFSPSVLNKNASKQVTGPIKGKRVRRKLNVKSPSRTEKSSESDVNSLSFSEKKIDKEPIKGIRVCCKKTKSQKDKINTDISYKCNS